MTSLTVPNLARISRIKQRTAVRARADRCLSPSAPMEGESHDSKTHSSYTLHHEIFSSSPTLRHDHQRQAVDTSHYWLSLTVETLLLWQESDFSNFHVLTVSTLAGSSVLESQQTTCNAYTWSPRYPLLSLTSLISPHRQHMRLEPQTKCIQVPTQKSCLALHQNIALPTPFTTTTIKHQRVPTLLQHRLKPTRYSTHLSPTSRHSSLELSSSPLADVATRKDMFQHFPRMRLACKKKKRGVVSERLSQLILAHKKRLHLHYLSSNPIESQNSRHAFYRLQLQCHAQRELHVDSRRLVRHGRVAVFLCGSKTSPVCA